MSEVCFDNVKSVVDDIAKEIGIVKYHINVKEDKFAGDNYSSKIVRAQIVEDVEEKRQINLLIKLLTISQDIRDQIIDDADTKFTEFECLAYETILPALYKFQNDHGIPKDKCFIYPKYYRGGVEYMKEYMILEDASYDGYKLYNKVKPIDYEHARLVLTNLARYHAVSFAMAEKDPEQFKSLCDRLHHEHKFTDMLEKMAMNVANSILPQMENKEKANVVSEFLNGCGNKLKTCYDSKLTAPYNVICHGDFHINNMLFKYKNNTPEVLFIDWQLVRYASPVTDIMELIFMSTDKKFRDKYYKQVCDDYYNALGENLTLFGCDVNKVYPRNAFEENLRDILPEGLVFGVVGCMILLQKPGDEKDLEKLFDENATKTMVASDEMLRRIDGCAEDIMQYKESMKCKK